MKKMIVFILSVCFFQHLHADILTVTNAEDSGIGSLRRFVEIANPGDSIVFEQSMKGKTIELLSQINIDKSIAIDGKNAPGITIGGKNISQVFFIQSDFVRLHNLTFTNEGTKELQRKTIYAYHCPSLLIENCTFSKNTQNNTNIITPVQTIR